jgi:RNA polymerase sigma-70 factor (ECF subfamily)
LRPDLVVRAQSGDREAFDAIAMAMYDRLYAIGRRILRDGHAAEDAVQDALIRGWRDLQSLRDPDRFEAWMHRLLVHACQDQIRTRRRIQIRTGTLDVNRSDPANDLIGVVQRDELERAFLQLPVEHRAVLVLTHYVGLPASEVGRILQIPPGTVYSRLHYGSQRMRAALTAPAWDASAAQAQEPSR